MKKLAIASMMFGLGLALATPAFAEEPAKTEKADKGEKAEKAPKKAKKAKKAKKGEDKGDDAGAKKE